MCNGQLQKNKHILAKALDNSKSVITCFCTYTLASMVYGLFSSHVVWKQHYSCADPYKELQNMVMDLCNKYRHFTSITFCTNFVLDARITAEG